MQDIGEFIEISLMCGVDPKKAIKNDAVWDAITHQDASAHEIKKVITEHCKIDPYVL